MVKLAEKLFELPIASAGNVVCTQPASKVYLLTFTSPPENRLTTSFCQALLLALDIIELKYPPGVVVTTSGITKFYSNGLDLEHAAHTPGFMSESLYKLWRRVLTYPMPTVALINGHAFAGGIMLAMMHDYRIMNPQRGFLCVNELELGMVLRPPMSSVFRQKVSAQTFRRMVLEAARFKGPDAQKEGIVDGLGGLNETLSYIDELKLTQMPAKGVYGALKREMWRETADYLEKWSEDENRVFAMEMRRKQDQEESKKKVQDWEKIKAKL